MAGIFGTDGVRARINTGPRAESVVRSLAAGRYFSDVGGQRPYWRASGGDWQGYAPVRLYAGSRDGGRI